MQIMTAEVTAKKRFALRIFSLMHGSRSPHGRNRSRLPNRFTKKTAHDYACLHRHSYKIIEAEERDQVQVCAQQLVIAHEAVRAKHAECIEYGYALRARVTYATAAQ